MVVGAAHSVIVGDLGHGLESTLVGQELEADVTPSGLDPKESFQVVPKVPQSSKAALLAEHQRPRHEHVRDSSALRHNYNINSDNLL